MTDLQRIMILSFIAEAFGGMHNVLPKESGDTLIEISERTIEGLSEEELQEVLTEMARKLYEELTEVNEGEEA